jgi:hypothetical protein
MAAKAEQIANQRFEEVVQLVIFLIVVLFKWGFLKIVHLNHCQYYKK